MGRHADIGDDAYPSSSIGDTKADRFAGIMGNIKGFKCKTSDGEGSTGLENMKVDFIAFGDSFEDLGGGLVSINRDLIALL